MHNLKYLGAFRSNSYMDFLRVVRTKAFALHCQPSTQPLSLIYQKQRWKAVCRGSFLFKAELEGTLQTFRERCCMIQMVMKTATWSPCGLKASTIFPQIQWLFEFLRHFDLVVNLCHNYTKNSKADIFIWTSIPKVLCVSNRLAAGFLSLRVKNMRLVCVFSVISRGKVGHAYAFEQKFSAQMKTFS